MSVIYIYYTKETDAQTKIITRLTMLSLLYADYQMRRIVYPVSVANSVRSRELCLSFSISSPPRDPSNCVTTVNIVSSKMEPYGSTDYLISPLSQGMRLELVNKTRRVGFYNRR